MQDTTLPIIRNMRLTVFCFLIGFNLTSAQKTYKNKAFGISCKVPAMWAEESAEGFDTEALLSDKERTSLFQKERAIYLVNFSGAIKNGAGGKIQIGAVYKPENSFEAFKKNATMSADDLKNQLDNFEYIQRVKEITIAGIKSVYFIFRYTMIVEGKKMQLRNYTYAIPYKNFLFHISMVDMPGNDCSGQFEAFINSIQLEKL